MTSSTPSHPQAQACRLILPGGRDPEHPSGLCAEAECKAQGGNACTSCLRYPAWTNPPHLQFPLGRYVRITSDAFSNVLTKERLLRSRITSDAVARNIHKTFWSDKKGFIKNKKVFAGATVTVTPNARALYPPSLMRLILKQQSFPPANDSHSAPVHLVVATQCVASKQQPM